jgi:FixJ family two-component response regulator
VIVITGREDSAARILAMQIGTVAFLIKPFDDEQFLEAVHRALGHRDLRNKTAAGAGANTVHG